MLRVNHPPADISIGHRRKLRAQLITVRRFQYHYALFLISFGFIMALVVGGITLYLLNHNYSLFIQAQLLTAPRLVNSLHHEVKLANEIIVGAFIGFIIFMGVVGIKFSHSIIVPVYLIQERIRAICRGDMKNASVRIRRSDEFQEFAETYNYMVESLKAQLSQDIERLKELKPDEKNRDAVHTWKSMIREKEAQLNGESVSADQVPSSRHAS